jgi:cell division protein FtsL
MIRKNRTKKRINQKVVSLIILSGVVLLITLKMYQSFKVDLLMQDLQRLDQVKKNLVNEHIQLQADVDRLSNIDRIMQIAERDYGMVVNTEEKEVILLGDKSHLRHIRERFAERTNNSEAIEMAGVR